MQIIYMDEPWFKLCPTVDMNIFHFFRGNTCAADDSEFDYFADEDLEYADTIKKDDNLHFFLNQKIWQKVSHWVYGKNYAIYS